MLIKGDINEAGSCQEHSWRTTAEENIGVLKDELRILLYYQIEWKKVTSVFLSFCIIS